jgi:two-component system CheB/CheR fusion protein
MQGSAQPKSHGQARNRDLADYQNHVKNLMAVICSIASRTVENSDNLEDFAAHFDGRLAALGRAQRILTRTDAFTTDLEELVREELLAQAIDQQAVTLEGPGVRLPQKVAENLGLALHELVTNAIKFGALFGQSQRGHLSLTWKTDGDTLRLEWRESGVVAMDTRPARSGFGREWLERGLAYQISARAELAFLPGGLACNIIVPLHLVAMEAAP